MGIDVVPFGDRHLAVAAELLAEQARIARRAQPALAARFEDASEARGPLDFVWKLPQAEGVVATAGGEGIGFLLGLTFPDDPSSYATAPFCAVSESWHEARLPRSEVVRALYAALAARWVEVDCTTHYVLVPASDPEAIEAWYSLGFGQDNLVGVCETGSPSGGEAGDNVAIRRAGSADHEVMLALFDGLGLHLAGSPIFHPFRPEAWGERQSLDEKLASEEEPYWLALREGKPVGMVHLAEPSVQRPDRPERFVQLQHAYVEEDARGSGVGMALFDTAMAWAREGGYKWCVVDWEPANLEANRFWSGQGLRPVSYLLGRRLETS